MDNNNLPPIPSLQDTLVSGGVACLTIVVNAIQIHLIRNTDKKRMYEKLLLSFSTSSLLSGIFGLLTLLFASIWKMKIHFYANWAVWSVVTAYLSLVSTFNLIFLSVDRLWAVASPLNHRVRANTRKKIVVLTLSWNLPLVFIAGYMIGIEIQNLSIYQIIHQNRKILVSAFAIFILLADILFLMCYTAIIIIIIKNKKPNNSRRQQKLSKTVFLCMGFVIVFLACTTPFLVSAISAWNRLEWLDKSSLGLFLLKGLIDPLIYLMDKCQWALCCIKKVKQKITEKRERSHLGTSVTKKDDMSAKQ